MLHSLSSNNGVDCRSGFYATAASPRAWCVGRWYSQYCKIEDWHWWRLEYPSFHFSRFRLLFSVSGQLCFRPRGWPTNFAVFDACFVQCTCRVLDSFGHLMQPLVVLFLRFSKHRFQCRGLPQNASLGSRTAITNANLKHTRRNN